MSDENTDSVLRTKFIEVLRKTRLPGTEAMVGGTNSPGEWDVIFHSAETLRLIQYWDVDTMLVKQLSSVARKPQVGHIPVYYDNQVRFTLW